MARVAQAGFWRQVAGLPLILQACGAASLSMLLPAIHGIVARDHDVSRAFFYSGLLGIVVVTLIGVAPASPVPLATVSTILRVLPVGEK